MNVRFIDAHRDRWPVAPMCRTIGFSERTYYAARARPPSARDVSDEAAKVEIRRVWKTNYQVYGARRIHKQLHREGHRIARCTVARLMPCIGIRGVQRGKKQFTTTPDTTAPRPPDLVDRRFVASRPNELWLADITYAMNRWDPVERFRNWPIHGGRMTQDGMFRGDPAGLIEFDGAFAGHLAERLGNVSIRRSAWP